ncbi:hypothetical protein FMN50_00015, partial [Rhodobacterales bacterium]
MTISDGGVVDAVSDVNIGSEAGAEGTLTISGAGSKLTAGDDINVGDAGSGTLTISDGGVVDAVSDVNIGSEAGAEGTLTI